MSNEIKKFALEVGEVLKTKDALDIQIIDVSDQTIITDYFIIATGKNVPNVKAIVDEVKMKIAKLDRFPVRVEGVKEARWVVLDYSEVLVHIFHKDEREFYNLERLWADGDNVTCLS